MSLRALGIVFLACLSTNAPVCGQKVKVFVLAGQSNMQGHGRIEMGKDGDLPFTARREEFSWLRDADGEWVEREDVWYFHRSGKGVVQAGNLSVGLGANGASIGPELAFGHALGEHFDEQVLLIKTAWGGQALGHTFRPPSAGLPDRAVLDSMLEKMNRRNERNAKNGAEPVRVEMAEVEAQFGSKYRQMLEEVRATLADLGDHFPAYRDRGYEIAGFFWHQGWNDGCNKQWAEEYEVNMGHFIADLRRDLKAPELPIVIATSGMGGPDAEGVAGYLSRSVEPAQVAAAAAAKHCVAVPTRQFQLHQPGRQKSHWFNSAESYCLVGDASARAMLGILAEGR